jgi:hypothetical protein
LLIVGEAPLTIGPVSREKWRAELEDSGQSIRLELERTRDRITIATLLERALVRTFERREGYWRLSNSIRRWYLDRPVATVGDIDVVPRLSFGTATLGELGVGVAFESGYLYRSTMTLADFFDENINRYEQSERRRSFDRLRSRDERRKGTLLYDLGRNRVHVCYFVRFTEGLTCATTGPVLQWPSLLEYYRDRHPHLVIEPDDAAVEVSFRGISQPVVVAAKLLRVRVMADESQSLFGLNAYKSQSPWVRREAAFRGWDRSQSEVKWLLGLRLEGDLWTPDESRRELLPCPTLQFAKGRTIFPPRQPTVDEYRRYYQDRISRLRNGGVYQYEQAIERKIHLVTPIAGSRWTDGLQQAFAEDFVAALQDFVGRGFKLEIVREDDPDQIVERLGVYPPGTAVVVFGDRGPADTPGYYLLSHGLPSWRLKRLTRHQVERKWEAIEKARTDNDRRKARRRWRDMIVSSVLDTLDQMDATPWRIDGFPYEACIAIDVGEGRRFFAVSALICRNERDEPSFLRMSGVWPKADSQHESINPRMLRDKLVELFPKVAGDGFVPIRSLLFLRDGHTPGEEPRGIGEGVRRLQERRILAPDAEVAVADVHKRTVKGLRLWSIDEGRIQNALEGHAVYLDERTALVACTGAATLAFHQTVDPCLLVAHGEAEIRRVSRAYHALAQLNYTNPAKARRLAQPLWESDARLQQRIAQDMRDIR